MTYVSDSFEEGTSGTGVTNLTSFVDAVAAGGGIAFDNTRAAHGSLSCKCTGSTNASYAIWSTSMGTLTQVWYRGYFHLANAVPAANLWLFNALQGTTAAARVGVSPALKVLTQESTSTTQTTSTNTVNANAWFRLEAQITFSATAGQLQVKLFNTMDATSPTETNTTGSALNTLANADHFRFGLTTSSSFVLWQDDIALSNIAYIGAANYLSDTDVMQHPGAQVDGGPAAGGIPQINVDDAVGYP